MVIRPTVTLCTYWYCSEVRHSAYSTTCYLLPATYYLLPTRVGTRKSYNTRYSYSYSYDRCTLDCRPPLLGRVVPPLGLIYRNQATRKTRFLLL